jgi:hypothetical protein
VEGMGRPFVTRRGSPPQRVLLHLEGLELAVQVLHVRSVVAFSVGKRECERSLLPAAANVGERSLVLFYGVTVAGVDRLIDVAASANASVSVSVSVSVAFFEGLLPTSVDGSAPLAPPVVSLTSHDVFSLPDRSIAHPETKPAI